MTADHPSSRVACEEKTNLLIAYQRATEVYSQAVAELAQKIGVTPKHDALNRAAEQARYASLDAHDRLDRHTREHGC